MLSRNIGDYHFLADQKSGVTFRWGETLNDNPAYAPVPELADISISNRCSKGCDFCYRESTPSGSLMTVEDYCDVLDKMEDPKYGNVFQVALGGGEPLEHPDFFDIIEETVKRRIVPNFTTNGRLLTEKTFERLIGKIGAMAISITDMGEMEVLKDVINQRNGVRVNLHYILSQKTISQAIEIVEGKYNDWLSDVNAIVFLIYKPAGRGCVKDVLKEGNELEEFLKRVKRQETTCKIGFDACFVPLMLHRTKGIDDYVDFCEGGFFSVYINEKKEVSPCSFSTGRDCYSLNEYDFYNIWLNKFEDYRNRQINNCWNECRVKSLCRGACPYYPSITTCYKER